MGLISDYKIKWDTHGERVCKLLRTFYLNVVLREKIIFFERERELKRRGKLWEGLTYV